MAKRDADKADKRIDFARRHFGGVNDTFNARSAMWRAEQLKDEIVEFEDRHKYLQRRDSMRPLEFPSYYMVALVTCLEWHARSRLFSLLSYDAGNFRAEDIKQAASADLLEQLLHENFSVAHLVAASTLVSDLGRYLAIFDRVLGYLEVKISAVEVLKAGRENPDAHYVILAELFKKRHALVHEIDITQVGHWNIRDPLSLESARVIAQAVLALMTELELVIWTHAKPDFPDLVPPEGGYISRQARLLKLIEEAEERILSAARLPQCTDIDTDALERSVSASRFSVEQEEIMLSSVRYAGDRYFSISEPLMNKVLESRLAYVRDLEKQLNVCGVTDACVATISETTRPPQD